MPTVQQLARELGLTSQEVMTRLKRFGRPAAGHLSQVDDQVAERLRRLTGTLARNTARASTSDAEAFGLKRTIGATSPPEGTPAADDGSTRVRDVPRAREEARAEEPPTRAEGKRQPDPPKPTPPARKKWMRRAAELPVLVVVAFLIAIVIKTFLVQAFFIPSGSMRPTLAGGDRVLVEKLSYLLSSPDQGDVIVFVRSDVENKQPDKPWYEDARDLTRELLGLPTPGTTDYIKRIAAVGGDTISYAGSPRVLTVNGEKIKEPYLAKPDATSMAITDDACAQMKLEPAGGACRVPADTVFVLGDNRTNSQDSRFLGPIEEEEIIGRAFVVIWPFKDMSGL
jgi:signal peptidase I